MTVRLEAHNGVDTPVADSSHASQGAAVTLDGNGGLLDGRHSVSKNVSRVWWFLGEAEVQHVFGFARLTAPFNPVHPLLFDGWWTDPEGGARMTRASWPTRPVTFYAHWKPATRWVVFDGNGGQIMDATVIRDCVLRAAESTTLPASLIPTPAQVMAPRRPVMPGLAFTGWYSHADGQGQSLDPTRPVDLSHSSRRVFYAGWRVIPTGVPGSDSSHLLTVSPVLSHGGV